MRSFGCLVALLLIGSSAPARASVGTTAIRLAFDGGAPRYYPTYGTPADAEIYAPVQTELAAKGLQFRIAGAMAEVLSGGKRVAMWPMVSTRAALPSSGRPPTVLVLGATCYLPVHASAALLGLKSNWDAAGNLLRIGDPGVSAAVVAQASSWQVPPAAPAQLAPMPAAVPARAEAARRAALAAVLARIPLPTGGILPSGVRLSFNAPAPVALAPAPPIRAIVRRGSGQLAFRGGQTVRNPGDLLPPAGTFPAAGGPLRGKVICVDAGHGGFSLGAQGLHGLHEKDACLAMAIELGDALRDAGATVIMPRSDDTYVSLDGRIDFANTQSADLFVSIHCNAMPVHNTVNGTETYYDTPQSADLARAIHPQVVQVVGERDGGIRRRGFAVIRRTTMPSVLVEVAYIDNLADEAKLSDPDFRHRIGQAIRDGVVHYCETH